MCLGVWLIPSWGRYQVGKDSLQSHKRKGNSLAAQWLGLSAFIAEGPGAVLGQETKIPQTMWHSPKQRRKRRGKEICASVESLEHFSVSSSGCKLIWRTQRVQLHWICFPRQLDHNSDVHHVTCEEGMRGCEKWQETCTRSSTLKSLKVKAANRANLSKMIKIIIYILKNSTAPTSIVTHVAVGRPKMMVLIGILEYRNAWGRRQMLNNILRKETDLV